MSEAKGWPCQSQQGCPRTSHGWAGPWAPLPPAGPPLSGCPRCPLGTASGWNPGQGAWSGGGQDLLVSADPPGGDGLIKAPPKSPRVQVLPLLLGSANRKVEGPALGFSFAIGRSQPSSLWAAPHRSFSRFGAAADMNWVKVRKQFVENLNQTVIHPLLDDLNDVLQKQVLSDEGLEKLKEISAPVQEQAKMYIDRVRGKDHDASLCAVENINPQDASSAEQQGLTASASGNLPAPSLPAPPSGATPPVEEAQAVQSVQGIKLCPPDLFEKIQKEKSHKMYPIIRDSEKRTRLALIICNTEFESDYFGRRDGSEVDMAGMEGLLTGLGYQVLSKTNLCSKGMAECLKDFASREEHKTSDSTFVVLMSHGVRAGLCGVKSEETKEGFSDILLHDTIYSILNNKNCPALRDKPKVIIIQACRGENKGVIYVSDAAVSSSADSVSPTPWFLEEYESDAIRREHVESDLICFFSTTPDNVSWRSPETGSIFIVQLIEHMQKHAWRCHLEEIFRKVQQAFKNNPRQMPTKERATLLKRFYLFPGH